jgi:hypothetical protein
VIIAVVSWGVHAFALAALFGVLVYAPPGGKAGPRLAEVSQALKKAARARGAEVVEGAIDKARAEIGRGWVRESELSFFARGAAQMEEGRRALERVELPEAEKALAKAEEIFELELGRPGAAALCAQAARERGVATWLRGAKDEARRAFRRAAVLDPLARLTEAHARPDVVKAFAEAAAPRHPKVKVNFVTSPEGGALEVDGQPVHGGAVELDLGEHWFRARMEGRRTVGRLFEAGPSMEVAVMLNPEPELDDLAGLRARPSKAGADVLSGGLGLDGVMAVAIAVDAGKLTLAGEKHAAGCRGEVQVRAVDGSLDEAAAALWASLERTEPKCDAKESQVLEAEAIARPRPEPAPSKQPKVPPKKPKIWERPWIWVGALGVATLAVGLGAGLGIRSTVTDLTFDRGAFTGALSF